MRRRLLLGGFAAALCCTLGGAQVRSLTIFPVILGGQPRSNVAEVVGVMLERAGMENVDVTETAFRPSAEARFADAPARFAAFVRDNAIKTDHALFAEVVGTPKTGVQEVRVIAVDRTGALVWVDRQRPGDPAFDRTRPTNPMTCCVVISGLYQARFGIAGVAPAGDGKLERRFKEKSGLPTAAERAAMKKRRELLDTTGRAAAMVVFPVQVGDGIDADRAKHLAETLTGRQLCKAAVGASQPHFKLASGMNEQKRLWDLARAFRTYVRSNPPTADYALHAEYVIAPNQKVWAVHFIVCDRAGEWVIVDFQNEHHSDFQRVGPKTRADCDRLVVERFSRQ